MSADLLGLFGTPSEEPKQPRQNSAASASQFSSSTADPFSFLQPSAAPVQPQTYQQTTPWTSRPPQQPSGGDVWGDLGGLGQRAAKPQTGDEEDDGWGDFEAPVQSPPPQPAPVVVARAQPRPTTRIVRAPTIDLMSNNLLALDSSPPEPNRLDHLAERPSWESSVRHSTESRTKNTDPNVLFDADDFDEGALPDDDEDEDDFGDFEGPAPAQAPAPAQRSIDLMATNFAPPPIQGRQAPPSQLLSTASINDGPSLYPQPPKSPSFQERNPFPGLGLKTPVSEEFPKEAKPRSPSPVTAWPSFGDGDSTSAAQEKNSFEAEWGAFDDKPAKAAAKPQPSKSAAKAVENATTTTATANSDWDWDDWGAKEEVSPPPLASEPSDTTTTTSPGSGPPPTNIPPPSVLLSIFPSILGAASTSLLKPTATASSTVKDRVHGSTTTIAFLRGYLSLATVAARIVAGRRLRWHRDKFLAQSMTISAATGGKGGMKLTGIDRSQSAREDREAADVVGAWREVLGRLRTAVAGANAAIAKEGGGGRLMRVPELAETMRVETVKGAATAPKACAVCGLRRDERVAKVDFEVEDSFGEWWVEYWGHRECRNFWVEHEGALRSR